MAITLNFTPEFEVQIYDAAVKAGVSLDAYIANIVQQYLRHTDKRVPSLPQSEALLIEQLNLGLPEKVWQRYHHLVAKRRAETLTPTEQKRLIRLTNKIEMANAHRIATLVKLAELRHTSLDTLMDELGIASPSYV